MAKVYTQSRFLDWLEPDLEASQILELKPLVLLLFFHDMLKWTQTYTKDWFSCGITLQQELASYKTMWDYYYQRLQFDVGKKAQEMPNPSEAVFYLLGTLGYDG